ncbi:MAG: TetR/AcrR family transcriptional regulator [Actinomycetota bacterium]
MRGILDVVREVKGPRPVMSREAEDALTPRQREVLDQLHEVFLDGYAHLTMAEMAAAASCSLRTLYEVASGKDELVRIVVDRHLWGIGRSAMGAVTDDMAPLEAIRAHLRTAHVAVADTTEVFANDSDADPGTSAIAAAHAQYLADVTRALLDEAVVRGDIADVDTAAVARVMANVGADFAGPTILPTLHSDPKAAADTIVDLVLRGLSRD